MSRDESVESYIILIDEDGFNAGELTALECWDVNDDSMITSKGMDQIIIEAANFSTITGHLNHGGYVFSIFSKPTLEDHKLFRD